MCICYKKRVFVLIVFSLLILAAKASTIALYPVVLNNAALNGRLMKKYWDDSNIELINQLVCNELSALSDYDFIMLTNNFNDVDENAQEVDYFIYIEIKKVIYLRYREYGDPTADGYFKMEGCLYLINASNNNKVYEAEITSQVNDPIIQGFRPKNGYLENIKLVIHKFPEEVIKGFYLAINDYLSILKVISMDNNVVIAAGIGNNFTEYGQYYNIFSKDNKVLGRAVIQDIDRDNIKLKIIDTTRRTLSGSLFLEQRKEIGKFSMSVGYGLYPELESFPDNVFNGFGHSLSFSYYVYKQHIINILGYTFYSDYLMPDPYRLPVPLVLSFWGLGYSYEIYFKRTRFYMYPGMYIGLGTFGDFELLPSMTIRYRISYWLSLQFQFIYMIAVGDDSLYLYKYNYPFIMFSVRLFDSAARLPRRK